MRANAYTVSCLQLRGHIIQGLIVEEDVCARAAFYTMVSTSKRKTILSTLCLFVFQFDTVFSMIPNVVCCMPILVLLCLIACLLAIPSDNITAYSLHFHCIIVIVSQRKEKKTYVMNMSHTFSM